jgi:hypothetical protein
MSTVASVHPDVVGGLQAEASFGGDVSPLFHALTEEGRGEEALISRSLFLNQRPPGVPAFWPPSLSFRPFGPFRPFPENFRFLETIIVAGGDRQHPKPFKSPLITCDL